MAETILGAKDATPSEARPPEDPYYPAFEREAAAFNQMLPQLLAQFPGEFVAVYGQRVIDRDVDELSLARRVGRKHPGEFVLINRVEPESKNVAYLDSREGFA